MNDKPQCFGDLNKVFPLNEEGIRQSPEDCIQKCSYKKECIIDALEKDSNRQREHEMVDAAYESGNINFFSRWAKKKSLSNRNVKKRKISIFNGSKK